MSTTTIPPPPSDTFTIIVNNVLQPNDEGNSSATIADSQLAIPDGWIEDSPSNLRELVNLVGHDNVIMSYYAAPNGTAAEHLCFSVWSIQVGMKMEDSTVVQPVSVGSTVSDDFTKTKYTGDAWVPLVRSNQIVSSMSTVQYCDGNGCWCKFWGNGGWEDVTINLKIVVTVYMTDYCTTGNNIHDQDMCYNYMGDLFNSQTAPASLSSYVQDYCARTVPEQDLRIFGTSKVDARDTDICACNMDRTLYDNMMTQANGQTSGDFSSVPPPCLFAYCDISNFQPASLSGCPTPGCFNYANLSGITSSQGLTIDQSEKCDSIYSLNIDSGGDDDGDSGDSSGSGSGNGNSGSGSGNGNSGSGSGSGNGNSGSGSGNGNSGSGSGNGNSGSGSGGVSALGWTLIAIVIIIVILLLSGGTYLTFRKK